MNLHLHHELIFLVISTYLLFCLPFVDEFGLFQLNGSTYRVFAKFQGKDGKIDEKKGENEEEEVEEEEAEEESSDDDDYNQVSTF